MKLQIRLAVAVLSSFFAAIPFVNADPVKIMSYNIQGGNGKSDSNHCNNIAQVIHDSGADIVAMNEVHNNWYSNNDWGNFFLSGDQQWIKIADRLGALYGGTYWERAYAQTWTKLSTRGTGHGIAIISRWAFQVVAEVSLDVSAAPDGEPRKAFIAYVSGAPTPFYFVCTHLSYQQNAAVYAQRARNIRAITEAVNYHRSNSGRTTAPVVLAGDLNTSYNTDKSDGQNALGELRYLDWEVTNDINPQGTFGGAIFDYICFYKNAGMMRTLSHKAIPENFSDHDPCISVLLPESDSTDFSVSPKAQTLPNSAGTKSISLAAPSWLPWKVSSNAAWCVPVVSNGIGAGTLNFSLARNTTELERTATITVTETATNTSKTFTISQSAPASDLILEKFSSGNMGGLSNINSASAGGYGNYNGFSFSTPAFASRGNSWASSAYLTNFQFAYAPAAAATAKKFYLNIYSSATPSAETFVAQSALLVNNPAVVADYHAGYSGIAKSNNTYTFTIPAAGNYKLRYWADAQNEIIDSNGTIAIGGTAVSSGIPSAWASTQWTTPAASDIPESLIAQKNSWNNSVAIENFRLIEVPITVSTAGTLSAKFIYSSGSKRLNLMGADLIATNDSFKLGVAEFGKIELQENTKYHVFFSSVPVTNSGYSLAPLVSRMRLGKLADGMSGTDAVYTNTSGAVQGGGWLPIYKTEFASIDQEPRFASPTQSEIAANGDIFTDEISISTNIAWTVAKSADWISLSCGSGNGNGTITFTLSPNTDNFSRTGTVTITAGTVSKTFTITQGASVLSPILDYAENPNFESGRDFADFTKISLVSPGAYNGFTFTTGSFTEQGANWRSIAYLTSLFYAQAHNYWNATPSNIYANIYTSANPNAATFVGQSTGTVKSHSDFRTVVAKDYHAGFSGFSKVKNTYTLTVPCAGKYKLRYWVDVASEGLDSSGNIMFAGTAEVLVTTSTWNPAQWTMPQATTIPPELLAQKNSWNVNVAAGNLRLIEVPMTASAAGTLDAKFIYTSGSYRLNIMGVDLVPVCGEKYGRFVELAFDNLPVKENAKYYVFFSTVPATKESYAFSAAKSRLRIGTLADGLIGDDAVCTNTSGGTLAGQCMPIYNLHLSSNTQKETFVLDVPAEQFVADAQKEYVSIETNLVWEIASDADWIVFSSTSGSGSASLEMDVSQNTSGESRTGTVTITAGGHTETFSFSQLPE